MMQVNSELVDNELKERLLQAINLKLGIGVDALETYFLMCERPDSFAIFIEELIETNFWQRKISSGEIWSGICIELAREIDRFCQDASEPNYHSRRHFKEVCLALTLLLMSQSSSAGEDEADFKWRLTDEDCWVLLLAAIGHDFGHEGRPNRHLGEQEEKACHLLADFLKTRVEISPEQLERLQILIRATEPSLFNELMGRVKHLDSVQDIETMKVLLVEADLFASMLPTYGVRLGKLLAEEFATHDPALAQLIASSEGRKSFLQSHPYVSPNSQRLQFNEVIRSAIIQVQP